MKNDELAAKLNTVADQLDKVKTEVENLKGTVNDNPDVPQAVVDAVNRVAAAVQAVDDIDPDAVTGGTDTGGGTTTGGDQTPPNT